MKLSPSVLSADFAKLGEQVRLVDEAGADYIHLDVMDGKFVPNISFGMPVIEAIRKVTDKPLDVHLMIEEPIRYLEEFKAAGADIVTVHAESCVHLHRTISRIRELDMKAGVALNPATSVSVLNYIFDDIENSKILEEVIHVISLSIRDNYDVKDVVFVVNNEQIYKSVLKTLD